MEAHFGRCLQPPGPERLKNESSLSREANVLGRLFKF